MGAGAVWDWESTVWADEGLAAVAGLAAPALVEVALPLFVAAPVLLDCAGLGLFAGPLA